MLQEQGELQAFLVERRAWKAAFPDLPVELPGLLAVASPVLRLEEQVRTAVAVPVPVQPKSMLPEPVSIPVSAVSAFPVARTVCTALL